MAVEPRDLETVALAGPITLYEAIGVRETLARAISAGKPIRIELADTTSWDLAGLQLLLALERSAKEHGLAVQVAGAPGVFSGLASRCGLGDWLAGISE